jgi:hypothetical protein
MKIGTGKAIYFYGHTLHYIYTANACDILKVLSDRVHHLQSGWMCHFLEVIHQCGFFIHQHLKNWMCIVSGGREEMASLDAGRDQLFLKSPSDQILLLPLFGSCFQNILTRRCCVHCITSVKYMGIILYDNC